MLRSFALLLAFSSAVLGESKPTAVLPANARLAIIGDSITEQKLYSKYLETYLLACAGRIDVKCFQFGWSGERADGWAARAENDLSVFSPTVATTCYGMNDGGYVPYNAGVGGAYEKNMRNAVAKMRAAGVQQMALGSPGAVDTKFFNRPTGTTAAQYNESLAKLRDIDRKLATEFGTAFANVHDEMIDAMAKAKAKLGEDYDVCGRDGVHPGANGQLLMAAAFLKALGLRGEIGTITVDMNGAPTASEGHEAAGGNGTAEVTSTKWPFCFEGDAKAGTRSILPFCDFNEKLNRFTLRVKNLNAAKAKVSWGAESKEFSKEQLEKGINLAAEFSKTPFDAPFMKFMGAVAAKQSYETPMIKNMVTGFRAFAADVKEDAEFAAALDVLKRKMMEKQQGLDEAARKLLVPVKHAIKVEAL
jgi:lysophospholipase L1-like esterase